jgi:hypothetical protein
MVLCRMVLFDHRPSRLLVFPYLSALFRNQAQTNLPLIILSFDEGDEMLFDILEVGRYSRLTGLSGGFMGSLEEISFIEQLCSLNCFWSAL